MSENSGEGTNSPETSEVKEATTHVEHTTEHEAQPDTQAQQTSQRLSTLEEAVNGLIQQIADMAPNPTDKSPHDKPWTHKNPLGS